MHNKILERLCKNGFEAFIVGGAVRDLLLGNNVKDYDIVTNASNEQISFLFSDYKVNNVGINFQVSIVSDGINTVEIATYRKDIYSKEGLTTIPITSLQEDLSRRDLTINSLAMCHKTGDIIDLFDGINDLKNNVIKFVGSPIQRIEEDNCRILRAIRFYSKIGGVFEEKTHNALRFSADLVKNIPKERIRIEVIKVMKNDNSGIFFERLQRLKILKYIFPSLDKCYLIDGGKFHNETVFEHCMITGDSISKKFPLLKIAGFLHDCGKGFCYDFIDDNIVFHGHEDIGTEIAKRELTELKFSNEEINYITNLISFHMRSLKDITPKALRKLIKQFKENDINYRDYLRLKIADRKANKAKNPFTFSEIRNMVNLFKKQINISGLETFSVKDLKVNGNDVMEVLNIEQGKLVGDILKGLFEIIIENPELNKREILIEKIKNW